MSSYCCEPDRGSEFETGWQELLDLASKCTELMVITRPPQSLTRLEQMLKEKGIQNTTFLFFDLPHRINSLKNNAVFFQMIPYLWEVALFFFLKKNFARYHFEYAHRATIGSYRFPSLLWYFAPHFTWGPLASGETVPIRFLTIFSLKGRITELMRILIQRAALIDPLVLLGLYKARHITVATSATKNILPKFAQKKVVLQPNYYIVKEDDFQTAASVTTDAGTQKLKLLFVGRLLEWKGIMLILKALKKVNDSIGYEFNIVGKGPDESVFRRYAAKHNLRVNFLGNKPRRELSSYYLSHNLFVCPDLHGRGSFTMCEAKMHNLPVLMLDITDPDCLTGKDLNILVTTKDRSISAIVAQIADELVKAYQRLV